ncbi:MAG: hypothetical protein H6Q48_3410, partial [Deltaproteobacteria bacterium]|nr:hypothetical protein [Deltaproteobacteria bacterium]
MNSPRFHVSHSRIKGSVMRGETTMMPNSKQGIVNKHTKPRRWSRLPALLFFAALLTSLCFGAASIADAQWQVQVTSPGAGSGGYTDRDGFNLILDGDPITIQPFPDLGYKFSSWTGDINSTDNPLIIDPVSQDYSIQA